ncbi:MAG: transglycosylase SLT domain-containing protein [Anaerolineae bacterium]|nr:transglycosylase SLT domain-containing protein [Anaerolineae bacterium]
MRAIERAMFPSILGGCLFIFLFSNLLSNPKIVLASAVVVKSGVAIPVVEKVLPPEIFDAPNQEEITASPEALFGLASPSAEPGAEALQVSEQAISSSNVVSDNCQLAVAVPESVRQWCSLIQSAAQEHGLDPNLVAAVIFQESHGNPNAISHSGAVGLMQVMPSDGLAASFQCINGPCFAGRPSSAELYDPAFNISYGCRMLAGLVQKHDSLREALRAYGPANSGYYYADLILSIYNRYQQAL